MYINMERPHKCKEEFDAEWYDLICTKLMVVVTSAWGWEWGRSSDSGVRKLALWNCLFFLKECVFITFKHLHLICIYDYFCKKKHWTAMARWLSWLEYHPHKPGLLVPSPVGAHMRINLENECLDEWNSLSFTHSSIKIFKKEHFYCFNLHLFWYWYIYSRKRKQ